MKKLILFLTVLLMSAAGTINAKVVRNGNTFSVYKSATTDSLTPYTWTDKDGQVYPIYISSKGACYIKKVSKKTGKEYKQYLPKEAQEQIRKELGYE